MREEREITRERKSQNAREKESELVCGREGETENHEWERDDAWEKELVITTCDNENE